MALIQVTHLAKSFGILRLFDDLNFVINKGQKVGLIAPNGSGKSTLLKIIAQIESQDGGEVIYQKDMRMAYLPQVSRFDEYESILAACMSGIRPEIREVVLRYEQALALGKEGEMTTLFDEMEAAGAWDIERQLSVLLDKLQITDPMRSPKGLSGGECKRIALASVLIDAPDLVILDEPTNHLDPDIIEWLEEYLSSATITLLMVTHDRYFLDKVCDTILEMDQGELYKYDGNYSQYLAKREARMEQLSREQQSLRNLYKTELEWMRRMPQARATKAKYRKDAFYEIESKLKNNHTPDNVQLDAASVYIGKKIFEAHKLCKSYGDRVIIKDFSYIFARRERAGIIGKNGAGKTTLINLILQRITPDSGTIEVGETVRFGHFTQEMTPFEPGKKVIEVITDKADRVHLADGSTITAMQLLNRFLFPPARQQDYVEKLSGGELRRLQLCRVLMEAPNFLVLDEPTNDLDIPTLQVLEEYLRHFDGCVLIVSHDRYFMDNLTDHLFVLDGTGSVTDFPGNYTEYRLNNAQEKKAASAPKGNDEPKMTGKERNREKTKLSYKEQKEWETLEALLPELETKIATIQEEMSSGLLDATTIQAKALEYEKLRQELDQAELRWLELSEFI